MAERSPLATARARADLTQQQLADLVGVAIDTVKRAEAGKTQPRLSTQFKIADALNVSVDDLFPDFQDIPA